MRPTTNWDTYATNGFNPYMSSDDPDRIPVSVLVSRDHKTYPSGSPVNPGYAYGTFLPLFQHGTALGLQRFQFPYTLPQQVNPYNSIPLSFNNTTQWINPQRSLRMKGLTELVPGMDTSQLDEVQQYLGNAQG